jgi:hypothetical protein
MKPLQALTFRLLIAAVVSGIAGSSGVIAQEISDSTIEIIRSKIMGKQNKFSYHAYVDTYYIGTINSAGDTSDIIPFSVNSPVRDQIRLNLAALEFVYNTDNIRGKVAIQYGDAPNLLASPSSEWLNNIRQANFGVRIVKNLWLDCGYMITVVGYESAWAALNQISYLTVGGYFEPGNVLGVKLSYQFSDKFSGGVMVGNPYSLAYSHDSHLAGFVFFTYQPTRALSVNYNNFFGNQAPAGSGMSQNVLYNNLYLTWNPGNHFEFVGELDFAGRTNSGKPPDTTKTATMLSGFLQAGYRFNDHFSVTTRYEHYNDPEGFFSGVNSLTNRGLRTNGFSCSVEYKPVQICYFRLSYRYLGAYPGSKVFSSNTSDQMQAIYLSAGVGF